MADDLAQKVEALNLLVPVDVVEYAPCGLAVESIPLAVADVLKFAPLDTRRFRAEDFWLIPGTIGLLALDKSHYAVPTRISSNEVKKELINDAYTAILRSVNDVKEHLGKGITQAEILRRSKMSERPDLAAVGWSRAMNLWQTTISPKEKNLYFLVGSFDLDSGSGSLVIQQSRATEQYVTRWCDHRGSTYVSLSPMIRRS
jgi:hypothetical protein